MLSLRTSAILWFVLLHMFASSVSAQPADQSVRPCRLYSYLQYSIAKE